METSTNVINGPCGNQSVQNPPKIGSDNQELVESAIFWYLLAGHKYLKTGVRTRVKMYEQTARAVWLLALLFLGIYDLFAYNHYGVTYQEERTNGVCCIDNFGDLQCVTQSGRYKVKSK